MTANEADAEDLTQESFISVLRWIDSFRGDASAYTWLFRIAMNLAISRLRKVQRKRVFSLNAPATGESIAELIVYGKARSIPLAAFAPNRFRLKAQSAAQTPYADLDGM